MTAAYLEFSRAEWARLRAQTPLTLSETDLDELRGINERVSLAEVEAIYLPLSRLLNLHVAATQTLQKAADTFLGKPPGRTPYVIGVAGSVAVGKSTVARILQALLSRWPDHPRVDLVTTDGFLFPNKVLEARGLLERKGFPESYDVRRLMQFMTDVKAGTPSVDAPVYSHQSYDIVRDDRQVVDCPDILIVEGLNVLQTRDGQPGRPLRLFVSDFFDFSIYMDAEERDVEEWYVARFRTLRETVFQDPGSYFHRYAAMTHEEAEATARRIWRTINGVNLRENIAPTRERARVVMFKDSDHAVKRVRMRRI
ncbi:MAG: type I pantothenate kinase [Acidobacteriota bacterium]|nr:type I pantothenate kinase [Acidobacteriota bacterium]